MKHFLVVCGTSIDT